VTTFGLVRGAWHGAWCWEKLTPFLKHAGHAVVAPDLPIDDGSADFDTYADAMCSALQDCEDKVVVVGHSMGGPLRRWSRLSARRIIWFTCAPLFRNVDSVNSTKLKLSRT
jgi:esterase/lipase